MRGEPNWHFDTLKRPDGGQGSRGQKHLCEEVSVVAHCVLFQVCPSVCLLLGLVYMNGEIWFTHLLRGFSLGVPKTLAGGTNLGIDNHMFFNIFKVKSNSDHSICEM